MTKTKADKMRTKTANGRRAPKQARAVALVDAVLEATAQVLRVDGPEAASTNRIAERAGVSIGSLYQYFPNKTALFTALSERHVERLQGEVEVVLGRVREHPSGDLIRFAVESFFAIIRVDAPLHAALQRVSLWGIASGVLKDFRDQTEDVLVELLLARIEDFDVDIDEAEVAARVALRALAGIADASILADPSSVEDPALVEETIRLIGSRFRARS